MNGNFSIPNLLIFGRLDIGTVRRFQSVYIPILCEAEYMQMNKFIQHGGTSCLEHCVAVAYCALLIADRFHIKCDRKSLLRGALLHDYFLYDWHEKDASHRWHGFHHPEKALRNAERDFKLNTIERNIISRHMFPLTPIPPIYTESILVCIADKLCASYEVIGRDSDPYKKSVDYLSCNHTEER